MKSPSENPSSFEESIEIGVEMTPQEAIEKIAAFHGASAEGVISAFIKLRGFEEGTVKFKYGVQNGWHIIVMEGYNPDGQRVWNHLIDRHTGQPLMRTG